ncbi:MAG: hypothetical protein ABUT39_23190 [Acidobacteriota bacterium]
MRVRRLALFPFLFAAAFAAVLAWIDGGEDDGFVAGQRILVRILAAAGCWAAASAFESGDRLRRAWLWLGIGTLFILARDLLRLSPVFAPSPEPQAAHILTTLGILANLAELVGIWRLARAWSLLTIDRPGGRAGLAAVFLVTSALALGVAGPGALHAVRAHDLILVTSALVDIVTLCLIAPLLLTALALRGGTFFWPWALITASRLSWLLYDAVAGLAPGGALQLPDLFRGLAENFLFVAGLAQFLVVRHVRSRARATGNP